MNTSTDYSGKTLYVLLAPANSGQSSVAIELAKGNSGLVHRFNGKHTKQGSSLLSSRSCMLEAFANCSDKLMVWADSWIEQCDAHYQEHGVFDYDGLALFLEHLSDACARGLLVKFAYVTPGPVCRKNREVFDSSWSDYFVQCALTKQKRADLAALNAIDTSINSLLELLQTATLETMETA